MSEAHVFYEGPHDHPLSQVALRLETSETASYEAVRHAAITIAHRLNAPIVWHWGDIDHVVHFTSHCPPTCPWCADRNPELRPE